MFQNQSFVDPLQNRCSWKIHKIHGKTSVLESLFKKSLEAEDIHRCSSKQLFLKSLQTSQESTCVGVIFNKVSGPQSAPFRKHFFYRTSAVAASDIFRFPACNFIKKETPAKIFICEFCKTFKNVFWQKTFLCLSVNFEKSFRSPLL